MCFLKYIHAASYLKRYVLLILKKIGKTMKTNIIDLTIALKLSLSSMSSNAALISSYSIDSGFSGSFGGIQSSGYHGIRFNVTGQAHITGLTGYMAGDGDYFGAIAAVDGPNGLPTITLGNAELESVAYGVGVFNSGGFSSYSDNTISLDATLSSGYYVAFFGAYGGIFAQNSGLIAFAQDPSQSLIPTTDYVINSSGTWLEAPSEVVRIELLGSLTPVPIPGALWLFISGGMVMLYGARRSHSRNFSNYT